MSLKLPASKEQQDTFNKELINKITTLESLFVDGHLDGLQLTREDSSKITIAPGRCADSTNSVYITVDNSISGSITDSLDKGAEANSTWYYVFVIHGRKGTKLMFSTERTTPTLPEGFKYFRFLGSIYNNSSGNFMTGKWTGNGRARQFQYDAPNPDTEWLTAYGSSSGSTQNVVYIPPTCERFQCLVWLDPFSAGSAVRFKPQSSSGGYHVYAETTDTAGSWRGTFEVYPFNGQVFVDTSSSSDQVYAYVSSYIDEL